MGNIDNNGRIELRKIIEFSELFSLAPNSFLEIGSHTGKDAEYISYHLGIDAEKIYVLEAHPVFFTQIKKTYPNFEVYNLAAWNKTEDVHFFATSHAHDGRSSVKDRDIYENSGFVSITVSGSRMDDFFKSQKIPPPDIVKIDVEGAAFEVLQGFGEELSNVKLVQVETEQREIWQEQKIKDSVFNILHEAGFSLAWQVDLGINQNDSVWVNNKYFTEQK